MAAYPLQSLLNVRKYRKQNAQNAVRQAEHAYRKAEEQVLAHIQKIKDYHTWRLEEEERKYAEILGKETDIDGLENFRNYFSLLKEKELNLELELTKLKEAKEQAKIQIEQRREEFKMAKKNTAKIDAHRDIWKQQDKKEQELKEELETEEFKPLPQIGTECAE